MLNTEYFYWNQYNNENVKRSALEMIMYNVWGNLSSTKQTNLGNFLSNIHKAYHRINSIIQPCKKDHLHG